MQGINYWGRNYETRIIPITIVSGQTEYPLEKIDPNIRDSQAMVAIAHRVPQSGAYTKEGALLADATVFHAAHLELKDRNGALVYDMPLAAIGYRSGGDNNFLMFGENSRKIDFDTRQSVLRLTCPSGTITTAAGQQFELIVYFENPAKC